MNPLFSNVAILGLGLIGGSIALELKKRKLAAKVVGISRSWSNRKEALRRKAVDQAYPAAGPFLSQCDLIVLATPVQSIVPLLNKIRPYLKKGALVTDVGSVKGSIVSAASRMKGLSFVGGHPIAGTEQSGMKAAQLDLFREKKWILTPSSGEAREWLPALARWVQSLGATAVVMEPGDHDRIFSAVSHLPNVAAYALANTVAGLKDPRVLKLAGSSLRGMTRVAESPPEMWRDVCLANRASLLHMLVAFDKELQRFRKAVQRASARDLEGLFEKGRKFRLKLRLKGS